MTNSHVLEIWQDEFQEIYKSGGLFNLVCHPQVIGRPSRLALLREFINFTMKFPNVWYATGATFVSSTGADGPPSTWNPAAISSNESRDSWSVAESFSKSPGTK